MTDLRKALEEIARVGKWTGTDGVEYTTGEGRLAQEALAATPPSRPVKAGAEDHRVYFACESCEEHNPEGAVSCRSDIAVMPDGTWLCDGCYSDCEKTAYGLVASDIDDFEFPRFEDLPRPAAYPADPAVSPQNGGVGPLAWTLSEEAATQIAAIDDNIRMAPGRIAAMRATPPAPGADRAALDFCDWLRGFLGAFPDRADLTDFEANIIREKLGCTLPRPRIPKVRTSHHRNKEEAARLQALVDERCAPTVSRAERSGGGA